MHFSKSQEPLRVAGRQYPAAAGARNSESKGQRSHLTTELEGFKKQWHGNCLAAESSAVVFNKMFIR